MNEEEKRFMHVHQTPRHYTDAGRNSVLTTKDFRDGFEILRLCIGRFFSKLAIRFQSKSGPRSNKLHTPCGEFLLQSPPDYEDAQLISRIEPKSAIGPVLSARELESRHGLDVMVPSTSDPTKRVWVTTCFGLRQLCRQQIAIGATPDEYERRKFRLLPASNILGIPGQAARNSLSAREGSFPIICRYIKESGNWLLALDT